MTRRQFLRGAAIATAAAPAIPAAIARATSPLPAAQLLFVDWQDIEFVPYRTDLTDLSYPDTKPLDLDQLFRLCHELKRNREKSSCNL